MIMENLNLVELLRDCPTGMELDCTVYENLEFDYIDEDTEKYPIICRVKTGSGGYNIHTFTEYGCFTTEKYAKCVIFPKGKTTWEGFHRPFEDGDILTYTSNYTTTFICRNKYNEPNFSTSFYVACNNAPSNNFLIYNKHTLIALNENCDVRLATKEEKQNLFDAIKSNGYKWNPETKTLEKLPKFKVGDKIRHKETNKDDVYEISKVYDDSYGLVGFTWMIYIKYQDQYELVPHKFDITTLKPFESRVLVRDYDNRMWIPTFWGKRLEDDSNCRYLTTNGCYKYCIPYECNQHLLGTTNDCDEYYKTWEK